jgi:hypothetical protein
LSQRLNFPLIRLASLEMNIATSPFLALRG